MFFFIFKKNLIQVCTLSTIAPSKQIFYVFPLFLLLIFILSVPPTVLANVMH